MNKEDKISKKLCEELNKKKKDNNKFRFRIIIDSKKKIFIGTTCSVCNNDLNLFFQSAEQDIIVYLDDIENNYNFEGTDFFKKYTKSLPHDKILIPLVIFETKYKNVITHTVRQYSEIGRMIKYIFPFCMYNLLLIDVKPNKTLTPDRIYMSSKHFDRVIRKNGYQSNRNNERVELIDDLYHIIENHLRYLKNETFFSLKKIL